MNTLIFSYLELNSVLPFEHSEKLIELQELIAEFNSINGTNYDPVNKALEYMQHAAII